MNRDTSQNPNNPWTDRASLPAVSGKHLFTAALACFLCALGLPLSMLWEGVAFVLVGVALVYLVAMGRTPATTALIMITAIAATLLGGGVFAGAFVLGLIVGTAAFAFLFTTARSTVFAVVLPALAAVACYALTRDVRLSLVALSFLPAGLLLSLATLTGKGRTTAICFAVGGLLAVIVAWLVYAVYRKTGDFDGAHIRAFVENAREGMERLLFEARDRLLESAESAVKDTETQEAYDRFAATMSDDVLRRTVAGVFNVIPGLVAVACSIVAFEAQTLLNATYGSAGLSRVLTNAARFFTMSLSSAVLYCIAFLMTLFVSGSSMVGAVAENLALILLPGFFMIGAQGFLLTLTRTKGNGRIPIFLILFALLCCCASGSMLYLVALWGAYGRVMYAIRNRIAAGSNDQSQSNQGGDAD